MLVSLPQNPFLTVGANLYSYVFQYIKILIYSLVN